MGGWRRPEQKDENENERKGCQNIVQKPQLHAVKNKAQLSSLVN